MAARPLLLSLHGGAGALFGVLLFVVLFSGAWSLGHDDLREWLRAPAQAGGEALALPGAEEGARGGIEDIVGGAEVDDVARLDVQELPALGFVGVDADVLLEFECLLMAEADELVIRVVDVEGGAEEGQDFSADEIGVVGHKAGGLVGFAGAPVEVEEV